MNRTRRVSKIIGTRMRACEDGHEGQQLTLLVLANQGQTACPDHGTILL
ncbi:hypothetical protein KEM60_00356 [Austwickia sp. TVS 96-490-7B]|nr:hypothetical protein [Austwickia sp. TVS 96-490-7B]